MIEGYGSGSIPLTNGSGSERPKNMWFRIRDTLSSSFLMSDRLQSILYTPVIPEVDNPEVKASPQPEPVHHTDHLEGEHVLPQVISYLRMRTQHLIHQTKPLFGGGEGDFSSEY
jgi:hypothetical protein